LAKGFLGVSYNDDHDHGHNSNDGHIHAVEPHVWNSTGNALIIAGNTYKALSQLDKTNEVYYRNRYDSLCQRIQHTDSLIRRQLSAPEAAKAFMIYHPALSYFARDYGLHQISIEEGGKEPSPAHLKALIDLCQAEDVRVIFVQPEFDKRNAETIAQQTGTKVIPINPLSYDWEEEMLNVAKALAPQAATK
jgi:zinc transport system substrate-binding protein